MVDPDIHVPAHRLPHPPQVPQVSALHAGPGTVPLPAPSAAGGAVLRREDNPLRHPDIHLQRPGQYLLQDARYDRARHGGHKPARARQDPLLRVEPGHCQHQPQPPEQPQHWLPPLSGGGGDTAAGAGQVRQ